MPTPHKHAEVIRAFADGATIQVGYPTGEWVDNAYPHFDEKVQYRVKPEPAAPKWPQTTMTDEQLIAAWENGPEALKLTATANAAIAHLCESGALVPADKVRVIEAKARAEGKREGMNPVAVIEAAWRHMKLGRLDPETIQIILLQAAK